MEIKESYFAYSNFSVIFPFHSANFLHLQSIIHYNYNPNLQDIKLTEQKNTTIYLVTSVNGHLVL